jgi:hypothetical protein
MLAYNEFAYKKTKETHELGDRFLKKGHICAKSHIKRPHITRAACTVEVIRTVSGILQKQFSLRIPPVPSNIVDLNN